jgi:hypothetical protein
MKAKDVKLKIVYSSDESEEEVVKHVAPSVKLQIIDDDVP